jgi:hypothetical protein
LIPFNNFKGKHESIIHEVWETLGSLSEVLKAELVEYIFAKIETIPITSYDVHFIDFLQKVTTRAIDQQEEKEVKKWFGLDILWNGLEKNIFPSSLLGPIVNSLCHFLGSYSCKNVREVYLEKCIVNINEKRMIITFIQILRYLLGI